VPDKFREVQWTRCPAGEAGQVRRARSASAIAG
jgi:hypothetical protein